MKKRNLIIALSTLFFACGSNAENQNKEEINLANKSEVVVAKNIIEVVTIDDETILEETEGKTIMNKSEVVVKDIKKEKIVKKNVPEVKPEAGWEEVTSEMDMIKPEQEVGVFKANITSILDVDNSVWNVLLKKNVSFAGKVNYAGMKAEISKISTYLEHLKNKPPTSGWTKNEKLAYWINLYNASTVYLIAKDYPTSSITKLNGGKPWDKKFVKSGDKVYSLNQIENDIVRPRFNDSRIHAALNCAAVSCPILLNEAFEAAKLSTQLNKQCKVWVNDASKNKLEEGKVKVSQIFEWYKADFKADGGVVGFINKYANTKVLPKVKVSYLEYDWALNE